MASDLEKALGERVARYRLASGQTQAQLAERVGVVFETISRLERGSTIPSVARLAQIAGALGVCLHDLFEPEPVFVTRDDELLKLMANLKRRSSAEIKLVGDLAHRVFEHDGVPLKKVRSS